tara:strand:- start:63 stop:803 length:741 start_codon:yes stop_codon:yes gene_type:complete
MTKLSTFLIIVLSVLIFTNCKNEPKENTSYGIEKVAEKEYISEKKKLDYEVVNRDILETTNKAQIIHYVVYNDSIFTKDALSEVLLEVYFRNRKAKVFKNFDEPTVNAVYVFTSKEQAETEKSAWISMLVKGPNDKSPKLTYNEQKLKGLAGLTDKVKSEDEIALDNLNSYLKKKNVNLCDLYKQFSSYELKNIKKADAKYPDYGKKHMDLVTKLNESDKKQIVGKYKLADSIYTQTIVFGNIYCE